MRGVLYSYYRVAEHDQLVHHSKVFDNFDEAAENYTDIDTEGYCPQCYKVLKPLVEALTAACDQLKGAYDHWCPLNFNGFECLVYEQWKGLLVSVYETGKV